MKFIDDILNKVTMYRLVLYVLIAFWGFALIFSFFNLVPFSPFSLLFSTVLIVAVCYLSNEAFARVFKASTNSESYLITALILSLIITPSSSISSLPFLIWASVLAMGSKYIVAYKNKHLFNPAALAVFITSVVSIGSASWWVGNSVMLIPVLAGGILITRRIEGRDLVLSFFSISLLTILGFNLLSGFDPLITFQKTLLETPLLFFGFIMLTEPMSTPPTKKLQIIYGGLVGLLFAPQIHLGPYYFTPESALLVGNLFSFIVSPKGRFTLNLNSKRKIAEDIYEFSFKTKEKINFKPGQYMEWTLPHKRSDSRGNRRFFTLSSSPREEVKLGVRIDEHSSSFKKTLLNLKKGDKIYADGVRGDFTLPDDPEEKVVLIAGGIGITPFRSMVKDILEREEKRKLTLLYSIKETKQIAYSDIFDKAKKAGMGVKYIVTSKDGRVDERVIKKEIPDFRESIFYISGPRGLVDSFQETLERLRVKEIRTDFFPGFQND